MLVAKSSQLQTSVQMAKVLGKRQHSIPQSVVMWNGCCPLSSTFTIMKPRDSSIFFYLHTVSVDIIELHGRLDLARVNPHEYQWSAAFVMCDLDDKKNIRQHASNKDFTKQPCKQRRY